jgi:hypothetical protein
LALPATFVLTATIVLLGIALALVILHSGPARDAAIIAGVLVAIAVALCFLVARFVPSWRTVHDGWSRFLLDIAAK